MIFTPALALVHLLFATPLSIVKGEKVSEPDQRAWNALAPYAVVRMDT